jgi:hypothetical protein
MIYKTELIIAFKVDHSINRMLSIETMFNVIIKVGFIKMIPFMKSIYDFQFYELLNFYKNFNFMLRSIL